MYHLGKILKYEVVNNKTLTADAIAEGIGVSRTTLYKWFNRPDVRGEIIKDFCRLTNVRIEKFTNPEKFYSEDVLKDFIDKSGTGKNNITTDFDISQIKSLESKIQNLENELRFRDEIIKNKDAVIQTQAMTIKALQIALNNK